MTMFYHDFILILSTNDHHNDYIHDEIQNSVRKESPQLTIFFAPQVLRVEEHLATRDAVAQTRGEGFNPLALKDSMKMQVRHPHATP